MKRSIAVLMAVLMAALMCACNLVSVNEEKDMARVAVKIGDLEITKKEVNDYYQQYLAYASWLGVDASTQSGRETLLDITLEELIANKVIEYKAREKGFYNFTDEQKAEIETEITDNFNYFMDEARAMAEDEYAEDPDIDVEARAKELLKEVTMMDIGEEYDEEGLKNFLREYFEGSIAATALMESVNVGVTITEEEVRAAYDERLASEKDELTADPGAYQTMQEDAEAYGYEIPTLFTPEEYIRVRVIVVSPEDEVDEQYALKKQEIADKTVELGNLMLQEEDETTQSQLDAIRADVKRLEDETSKLFDEYMAPSKTKIDEAYSKLQSGADFTETMLEYGADSYFANYEICREKGRLLADYENSGWPSNVRSEAVKLTIPGSYTEVIESIEDEAYGYYIVQYIGKEPAGERSYDEVRDAIEADALATKQSEEWSALVEEWTADKDLVVRYEDIIASVVE